MIVTIIGDDDDSNIGYLFILAVFYAEHDKVLKCFNLSRESLSPCHTI